MKKLKFIRNQRYQLLMLLKSISFHFYENNCIIDYYNDTNKVITTEYNYLLNMPIHSFTLEKVNELQTEIDQKKK